MTPCHDAQVVGSYQLSSPLRLPVLTSASEDYTTAPHHLHMFFSDSEIFVFSTAKKQPATEEKAQPDVVGEDGEKPSAKASGDDKNDAEDTAEKPDTEEGTEEGAEDSEEKEPAAEGKNLIKVSLKLGIM